MPLPTKIWKTRLPSFVLLEILTKKGVMPETDLFSAVQAEFDDLGYKDFSELLMSLEVGGKIRTTSMARGKKRVELVVKR
jgi:hypothetical protein